MEQEALTVSNLAYAAKHHRRQGAVITLHDPGTRPRMRRSGPWLALTFEDLDDAHPGLSITPP